MTAVFGIAGFKNAGKTTLVERLVTELTGRGYAVSTLKHAHHAFDVDQEGRDSYRHRQAGAREVAIVSRNRWALVHELRGADEPAFAEVLAKLEACDLILVEGYKREGHAKIEVRRAGLDHPKLAGDDPTVVAIASDFAIADATVPVLDMNDIATVADFVVARAGLEPRP
jgi:molybdopterin-guanine dinucleotide biosynthesis protein MobB